MPEPSPPDPGTGLALLPAGPTLPAIPDVRLTDIYDALLADATCPNTRAGRKYDAEVFARFLGAADPSAACAAFVAGGRGRANAIALAFRSSELARGRASSSVNRRLATIRKIVALARRFDLIDFVLDCPDLKNTQVSDRRGPGLDGWRSLWGAAVAAGVGPVARRDRALLALCYFQALRKSEVAGLQVADVDERRPAIYVLGKGRTSKEWVTLCPEALATLRDWLAVRGVRPGPLFLDVPRGKVRADGVVSTFVAAADPDPPEGSPSARRIGLRTINRILIRLSERAGLPSAVRPHGLRHAGITRALDLTNGDIRKVARFARHANPKTTLLYDDARRDLAGEVARLLGSDGSTPPAP